MSRLGNAVVCLLLVCAPLACSSNGEPAKDAPARAQVEQPEVEQPADEHNEAYEELGYDAGEWEGDPAGGDIVAVSGP